MKSLYLYIISIFITTLSYAQHSNTDTPCALGKKERMARLATKAKSQTASDHNIDVSFYKLELDVSYTFSSDTPHYQSKMLKGVVSIIAKSNNNNLASTYLDLKNEGLVTDSVFVDGVKQAFDHISNRIHITLMQTKSIGQLFTITVYYQGIPSSSGFGSFEFTSHGNPARPTIHTLSEPFGASDWFPCKNDLTDKADSSEVWITAPSEMVSVSNGILQEIVDKDSLKTYKWKSRYSIATYLISIALAEFDAYDQVFNYGADEHMPVNHFVFKELNTPENRILMDETIFMLDLFTQQFGTYPFIKEKYGHANFNRVGGMEHQTCSSVSDFNNGLVAHELAHQWFGDKITCANWENIWMNEGFATYAEHLYTEAKHGKAAYKDHIKNSMDRARNAKGSIYVENPTEIREIFNADRSYYKGAMVLHMLRNITGDSAFFAILKNYMSSIYAYGFATTEDFQEIAESVTHMDLDYFFKQWIYGKDYPIYGFGWTTGNVLPSGQFPLYVKINQKSDFTLFTMPIKLRMTYPDNSTRDTIVFNYLENQLFTIPTPSIPINISFDPENAILKELQVYKDTVLSIYDENSNTSYLKSITISPNPAHKHIRISGSTDMTLIKNIEIYAIDGTLKNKLVIPMYHTSDESLIVIDVEDFKEGVYILKVHTSMGNETHQVFITKE